MEAVGGGEARAVLARLGEAWGWIVAFGVASALAGLIAVLWPGATLVVIAIIFAAQLLVAAIYQFVFAFAIPRESGWLRALFALLAIVSFAVALFLFGHVGLTLLILGVLLGAYWIAQGAIELFLAIEHPELRARAWIVVSGVLSVVAGGVVVLFPTTSLFFLTIVLGFWLVIFGVVLIVRGWLIRGLARRTKAVAQPT